MKSILKIIIPFILLIVVLTFNCNSNNDSDILDSDLAELEVMRTAIENLADTSECNDNSECLIIAFGSKPCGGPWTYLLYTSSIDTDKIEQMVEEFNVKQAALNIKHGLASDCLFVSPPSEISCINGVCTTIF